MENNIFDQHIHVLEAALKKIREVKPQSEWLEYHLQTQRKQAPNNKYVERLIKKRRNNIEQLVKEYDCILSQLVNDNTIENPILERYGNI